MRVLIVHNSYRQEGGEDMVARTEAAMLRANGHAVDEYWRSNTELNAGVGTIQVPFRAVWSWEAVRSIRDRIEAFRPHVVHVHNTWLMISPAVYRVARRAGAAVVQTLHNYRLLCPQATLLRDGQPCELCLGKRFPTPGVRHACYRDSRLQTALVGATVGIHRQLGTWTRDIDTYITLTEFARSKFIEGGLPEEQLAVKPNFLQDDPGYGMGGGGYALFVGRLAPEKGIRTLLNAWTHHQASIPLKIVGDGPLSQEVAEAAARHENIAWLGRKSRAQVFDLMRDTSLLIFPSIWYEGLPMTLVEAFACGLPALASRLGSMAELIDDGRTGLLFEPGRPDALAERIRWWLDHPGAHGPMRQAARSAYKRRFTAEHNYQLLMDIYETALARRGRPASISTA